MNERIHLTKLVLRCPDSAKLYSTSQTKNCLTITAHFTTPTNGIEST